MNEQKIITIINNYPWYYNRSKHEELIAKEIGLAILKNGAYKCTPNFVEDVECMSYIIKVCMP